MDYPYIDKLECLYIRAIPGFHANEMVKQIRIKEKEQTILEIHSDLAKLKNEVENTTNQLGIGRP